MKKILYLIMMFLLLSACCEHSSGVVTEKKFVPQHVRHYTTYSRVGKVNVPHHHTQRVPDKWILTIACDSCHSHIIKTVEQDFYNQVRIGDEITLK